MSFFFYCLRLRSCDMQMRLSAFLPDEEPSKEIGACRFGSDGIEEEAVGPPEEARREGGELADALGE